MATLLIEYCTKQLVDHRKDLIKFAWNHLKADDGLIKHWAYVNVCRFIAAYDTPPKIILQVCSIQNNISLTH
jgi:transformation/transcription domain-associated protein